MFIFSFFVALLAWLLSRAMSLWLAVPLAAVIVVAARVVIMYSAARYGPGRAAYESAIRSRERLAKLLGSSEAYRPIPEQAEADTTAKDEKQLLMDADRLLHEYADVAAPWGIRSSLAATLSVELIEQIDVCRSYEQAIAVLREKIEAGQILDTDGSRLRVIEPGMPRQADLDLVRSGIDPESMGPAMLSVLRGVEVKAAALQALGVKVCETARPEAFREYRDSQPI